MSQRVIFLSETLFYSILRTVLRNFLNQGYRNQLVTKIAALGLPSLVLLVAIAITSGDTPIKTALTFLGSFTGMLELLKVYIL